MAKQILADRLWSKADKTSHPQGCWVWTRCTDRRGYGRIMVNKRKSLAHRIAYELANGPIPTGLCVCHSCDNPACINPSHLWLGTNADNTADMVRKGRVGFASGERSGMRRHPEKIVRGENRHGAKLTEDGVRDIRRRWSAGESQAELGRAYGVDPSVINTVVHRKKWKHVA